MRWNTFLVIDEGAMPKPGPDGHFWRATVDCSGDNYDQLEDRTYDAVHALLKGRIDLGDTQINLTAAERFPNREWTFERESGTIDWRPILDAELPIFAGASVSAFWLRLSGNPGAREALEREWIDAAAEALAATADVDCAYQLLGGVQSLRNGLLPGARCFNHFNDEEVVYDCRNHVIGEMRPSPKKPADGKLVIVELERSHGG
jgi:hypothetical protein